MWGTDPFDESIAKEIIEEYNSFAERVEEFKLGPDIDAKPLIDVSEICRSQTQEKSAHFVFTGEGSMCGAFYKAGPTTWHHHESSGRVAIRSS